MKKNNIIQEKSYAFALDCIVMCRQLRENQREYIMSKQLLRSGTAVGANVEEALGGQSRKDFSHKLGIAYKEARESHYWLRLLKDSGYLDAATFKKKWNNAMNCLRSSEAYKKQFVIHNS